MQNLTNHLEEVHQKIGYRFDNVDLLYQAFTRSSYSTQYGGENNEVLELIGDKVLDLYVLKIFADRFGFTRSQSEYYDADEDADEFCIVAHKNEADFTELKKEIVANKTLAERIDALGFAEYLFMGDSDLDNHVERQEKVKADLFEAILGAIAIDSGWDHNALQNAVETMLRIDDFLKDVDTEEARPEKFKLENAVTTLKELAEHGRCSIPEYVIPDAQTVRDGELCWECTCSVKSWSIKSVAYATSKRDAKKYAAYLVLCEHYGIPDEFDESDED